MPGKAHYLRGRYPAGWATEVPLYEPVRYEAVYPGIDLIYYGNRNRPEYDFVVRPDADPAQTRLAFTGAESVELAPDGDLVLRPSAAEVRQRKPVVYQEAGGKRAPVAGEYVLQPAPGLPFRLGTRRQPFGSPQAL